MSLKYLIYLIALVSVFSSCEDTKTKKINTEKATQKKDEKSEAQRKRDSILANLKIPADGTEINVDLEGIQFVEQEQLIPFLTEYGKKNPENRVKIETRFGDIVVRLYNDTPLHRANFIRLVKMGYFNSTLFHRIADGFVVQGGNSDRTETQKIRSKVGDYLIPNEFSPNHTHKRGAFSAAKYSEQNVSKASSPFEFFIVQSKRGAHHLDNDHTVYGEVVSGMDVVDKMAKVKVDESEWPRSNIEMKISIID